MIDNKISIKGDAVVDIQRGAIGHRATWTGLTYTHACKAGKAQAEKDDRKGRKHAQDDLAKGKTRPQQQRVPQHIQAGVLA